MQELHGRTRLNWTRNALWSCVDLLRPLAKCIRTASTNVVVRMPAQGRAFLTPSYSPGQTMMVQHTSNPSNDKRIFLHTHYSGWEVRVPPTPASRMHMQNANAPATSPANPQWLAGKCGGHACSFALRNENGQEGARGNKTILGNPCWDLV